MGEATANPNRTRYACADGAVCAATFVAGARAVIEFLGREPVVLPWVEAGARFLYADGRHSLRGEGEEALWQAGGTASAACTRAAMATPLRLAPGSCPLFDPAAKSADDWSRFLFDLLPAINACLRAPVGDLPRVVKAWPVNHGMVGVRLQNIDAVAVSASRRPTAQRLIGSSCWGSKPSACQGKVTRSSRRPRELIRVRPASATSAWRTRPASFSAGFPPGSASRPVSLGSRSQADSLAAPQQSHDVRRARG